MLISFSLLMTSLSSCRGVLHLLVSSCTSILLRAENYAKNEKVLEHSFGEKFVVKDVPYPFFPFIFNSDGLRSCHAITAL